MKQRREEEMKLEAEREQAETDYDAFREKVLLRIADSPATSSQKFGSGQFRADGADLYDGIFGTGDGLMGVSVIATSKHLGHANNYFDYLARVARSISNGEFSRALMVFDGPVVNTRFQDEQSRFESVTKDDLVAKVDSVAGEPDEVVENVIRMFAVPLNGT